jgi:hypothetical protein
VSNFLQAFGRRCILHEEVQGCKGSQEGQGHPAKPLGAQCHNPGTPICSHPCIS